MAELAGQDLGRHGTVAAVVAGPALGGGDVEDHGDDRHAVPAGEIT